MSEERCRVSLLERLTVEVRHFRPNPAAARLEPHDDLPRAGLPRVLGLGVDIEIHGDPASHAVVALTGAARWVATEEGVGRLGARIKLFPSSSATFAAACTALRSLSTCALAAATKTDTVTTAAIRIHTGRFLIGVTAPSFVLG